MFMLKFGVYVNVVLGAGVLWAGLLLAVRLAWQ